MNVSMVSVGEGAASAVGGDVWGAVAEKAGKHTAAAASHHVGRTRPLLVIIRDLSS
jgi:hypothetical protein